MFYFEGTDAPDAGRSCDQGLVLFLEHRAGDARLTNLQEDIMRKRFFALIVVVVALGLMVPGVLATGHLLAPFTQSELDNNWEADRYFPTGGVT